MNTASRSENTARNIGVGAVRQVVTLLLAFAVRTVFVRRLGADYTGVNGLYSNILAMLSLAELGVGNVLVYSLYAPLHRGRHGRNPAPAGLLSSHLPPDCAGGSAAGRGGNPLPAAHHQQ